MIRVSVMLLVMARDSFSARVRVRALFVFIRAAHLV